MEADRADGDLGGFLGRIAVDAHADSGEADGFGAAFVGEFEAFAVGGREECRLSVLAVAVDGADGVEDPFGGESSGGGGDCAAGGAGGERGELTHDVGASRAVDGSVDSSASGEGGVGGVGDGV